MQGMQSSLWTALPGIINSFNPVKRTCEVQPTLMARVRDAKGEFKWVQLPMLVDCPVIFPSGGGFTLTFPLAKGDECLVIFASRCIDSWWQSGGIAVQAELRMHDLSDGFVMPGPRSVPNVEPAISASDVQLRSDDGSAYISIDASKNIHLVTPVQVTIQAPGGLAINANTTITGTLNTSGEITAPDVALTTGPLPSIAIHRHGGVSGGGSSTSPPTAGT